MVVLHKLAAVGEVSIRGLIFGEWYLDLRSGSFGGYESLLVLGVATISEVSIPKLTREEWYLDSRGGSFTRHELHLPHLVHGVAYGLRCNWRAVCLKHIAVGGVSICELSLRELRLAAKLTS